MSRIEPETRDATVIDQGPTDSATRRSRDGVSTDVTSALGGLGAPGAGTIRYGWDISYRPDTLEEMALDPGLRRRFEHYLAGDCLPRHLILFGLPGFGKTTIATIIAEQLYPARVLRVKAAETGNVEYIRSTVIGFMCSVGLLGGNKLVIFEEATGLSPQAQEALKVPLETCADLCRVMFLTNDVSKLDDAIRSRCDEIEMARPPLEECARILDLVLEAEGISTAPGTVLAYARNHFAAASRADLRSLLATAQHHIETASGLPLPPTPEPSSVVLWDGAGTTEHAMTDGAQLLNGIRDQFAKYLSLPPGGQETLALWTVFAWAHEAFSVSPILAVVSPTMRAGKTTLFDLLKRLLLPDATYHASSVTAAVLFRIKGVASADEATPPVEARVPALVLLADEADSWFNLSRELRGIYNSGHTRSGANVERVVGGQTVRFSTWYPKALASIEKPETRLPTTVLDRSIVVPMQRMRRGERRQRWPRHQVVPELEELRLAVATWVRTNFGELRALAGGDALAPDDLNDRARENWQPLMAIARLAGGGWEDRVGKVSRLLSTSDAEMELGVELLTDVRMVFDAEGVDRLRSVDLVKHLRAAESSPWEEQRLKPIRLAKLLRPFGVRPEQLWLKPQKVGCRNASGYWRRQFSDAWARYCSH